MGKELYDSVVSRLALVAPMFARAIVDSGLEKIGATPYDATPSQMKKVVAYVLPRLGRYLKGEAALEEIGAGQIVFGPDGGLESLNAAARMFLGLPPGMAPEASWVKARLGLEAPLSEIFESRKGAVLSEVQLSDPKIRLNVIGGPVPGPGAVFFLQDVTLRSALEDEVERLYARLEEKNRELARFAQDLKRANEEVKEFAFIVSHDLRAPLVNLKGFSCELRSSMEAFSGAGREAGAAEEARKEMAEALDFMDSSTTRMEAIIASLLSLSRMGSRRLVFTEVDLSAVFSDALRGLAHQLAERKAEAVVGPLPAVRADLTAIEQIVGNLLSNAVKFLEPGRPGRIEVSGVRGEETTSFCVRDNGRGVAKEDLPKLFMPFRRFGRQDVKGEGMGLAFAQSMARRHGGFISCESQAGSWTAFTVTLANNPG
jgi:signal transduction histidine kinase